MYFDHPRNCWGSDMVLPCWRRLRKVWNLVEVSGCQDPPGKHVKVALHVTVSIIFLHVGDSFDDLQLGAIFSTFSPLVLTSLPWLSLQIRYEANEGITQGLEMGCITVFLSFPMLCHAQCVWSYKPYTHVFAMRHLTCFFLFFLLGKPMVFPVSHSNSERFGTRNGRICRTSRLISQGVTGEGVGPDSAEVAEEVPVSDHGTAMPWVVFFFGYAMGNKCSDCIC